MKKLLVLPFLLLVLVSCGAKAEYEVVCGEEEEFKMIAGKKEIISIDINYENNFLDSDKVLGLVNDEFKELNDKNDEYTMDKYLEEYMAGFELTSGLTCELFKLK